MKLFSAIATLAIFAFIGVEIGAPIVDGFAAINSTLEAARK